MSGSKSTRLSGTGGKKTSAHKSTPSVGWGAGSLAPSASIPLPSAMFPPPPPPPAASSFFATTPWGSSQRSRNIRKDETKLLEGRKKAATCQLQEDQRISGFFKEMQQSTEQLECNKERVVKSLVELFRNQVPTEWSSRAPLFMAALQVCKMLASTKSLNIVLNTSIVQDSDEEDKNIENEEDNNTVASTLAEFARHAEMILGREAKSSRRRQRGKTDNKDDLLVAQEVLEVHAMVSSVCSTTTTRQKDAFSVMSPHDYYKKELGPLRFDIVDTLRNHHFLKSLSSSHSKTPVGLDTRRIFRELTSYRTSLPIEYGSSIFVRAVDNRLDMLRALLIGPENTPYANGCFVFDISLTANYPNGPPKVQFITTGGGKVRFNPNLYNNGKVCLSLLGTWSGPGWIAGESTLLQVLVSIQSLILVPDPYFNEPGYERDRNSNAAKTKSDAYSKNIRRETSKLCIKEFLENGASNYPEFEQVIVKHFMTKRSVIETQVREWAAKDRSLSGTSEKICSLLASMAVSQREARLARKRTAVAAFAATAAAVASTNSTAVIDLVGDDNDDKLQATMAVAVSQPMFGTTQVVDDDDRKLPAKRVKPTEVQVVDLTL